MFLLFQWEQRYIEESTMRQIAVDAASVPKYVCLSLNCVKYFNFHFVIQLKHY